jgi:hypothetical protein
MVVARAGVQNYLTANYRFPPRSPVEKIESGFEVLDASLCGGCSIANPLTEDEARRIAANIATRRGLGFGPAPPQKGEGDAPVALHVLGFALGVCILVLVNYPIEWLVRWLQVLSEVAETRSAKEKGVPVAIVGSFERILAFVLVLFDVPSAGTCLGSQVPISLVTWLASS